MECFYSKNGVKWINNYFYVEDYILIKIYKDLDNIYEVKIDKEDFDKVKNHTWREYKPRKNNKLKDIYNICTSVKNINNTGKRGDINIHQLILGTKLENKIVDHYNMDRFDNRKNNIKVVSAEENRINQESEGVYQRGKNIYETGICYKGQRFYSKQYNTYDEAEDIYLKLNIICGRDKISTVIKNRIRKKNIVLEEDEIYINEDLYKVFYYVCNGQLIENENKSIKKNNKKDTFHSNIQGVTYDKTTDKFMVRILVEGKQYNMGRYEETEANLIYNILNDIITKNQYPEDLYLNKYNDQIEKVKSIIEGTYDGIKYNKKFNTFYNEHKQEIIDLRNKENSWHRIQTILKEKYPECKIKSDTIKKYFDSWKE